MSDSYLKLKWTPPEGHAAMDRFLIEKFMVRNGGYWKGHGNGFKYHFRAALRVLMPWFDWNRWSNLLIDSFCDHNEIMVMGPASSGKTYCAAAFNYTYFQIFHDCTSAIISTTTVPGLQVRIWGAIKRIHNRCKERRPWLAGRVIESRCMLTGADSEDEGQVFLNGIMGVATQIGGEFKGLRNFVGIKNRHLLITGDELSLMEPSFLDAIPNLRIGGKPVFKFIGLGNPKDPNDALGISAEPHRVELGGWDAHEYSETTRTWKTQSGGIAIQLPGTDTPNKDHPPGLNPHPGLITPEDVEKAAAINGRDHWKFLMFVLGMMPKQGVLRRVISVSLCDSRQAFEEVVWGNTPLIKVAGLDPAYSGTGGDRTVLTPGSFGIDVTGRQILDLEPQIIIPVSAKSTEEAQYQIAMFVRDYALKNGIPPENIGFDSTGRGTLMSAFGLLWEGYGNKIVPIEFGGIPTDRMAQNGRPQTEKEEYFNQVTALWWAMRLVIEGRQLRGLSQECAREGSHRAWEPMDRKKVQVEPKEDMKLRCGRSPDLMDSVVTTIEIARRRGFQISAGMITSKGGAHIPQWLLDRQRKTREQERSVALVEA